MEDKKDIIFFLKSFPGKGDITSVMGGCESSPAVRASTCLCRQF